GMPDGWEIANNLNAIDGSDWVADPDFDGLINIDEYYYVTNPKNYDTDYDGMPDGWEIANNLNAIDGSDWSADADSDGLINIYEFEKGTNPKNDDTDYDGMPDGWEIKYNLNPLQNNSFYDTDNDGLNDLLEFQYGTNPRDPDSDNDGFNDSIDPAPLSFFMPTGIIFIIPMVALMSIIIWVKYQERLPKERKYLLEKIKQLKEENERQEKVSHEFLDNIRKNPPSTFEDTLQALRQIQEYIDYYIQNKEEQNTITFLKMKLQLYRYAIKQLKEIGMDSLLPTLQESKNKVIEDLIDLSRKKFISEYNQLNQERKLYESQNNYSMASEILFKMKNKLKNFINLLEDSQISTHTKELKELTIMLNQIEQVILENFLAGQYNQLKYHYNSIIEAIEENKLSEASRERKLLLEEANKFMENIKRIELKPEIKSMYFGMVNDLIIKAGELKEKISIITKNLLAGININVNIKQDEMNDITITPIENITIKTPQYNIPLYAKVVLLGESSVGKTHLILSMTGLEYKATQGSTIGVDKYYLKVKMPFANYDTQICLWDLGGQWNFRSINALFINEASVIVLVYDITRRETFEALDYWIEQIKSARGPNNLPILIVGNKIDVGGAAIADAEIEELCKAENIDRNRFYYETSAKEKIGIRELKEAIASAVDWGHLITSFNSELGVKIGIYLNELSKKSKIMLKSELINILKNNFPKTDELELNAILNHYASQDKVQFGRSDIYVILDPEYVDKKIAKILASASRTEGIIDHLKISRILRLDNSQASTIIDYLLNEKICYRISNANLIFPNVIHKKKIEMDDITRNILESGTIEIGLKFNGPGDLIFHQYIVSLANELGAPEYISNTNGLWKEGTGHTMTALLINYIPGRKGGVIRLKSGGANASELITSVKKILEYVLRANSINNYEEI
ncbi:MAG: GTP-binding protein, partial [Promethearchaeota archaeon]